jgi:methylated-DNA-[protein]-cysteine S-methyltransferase
MDRSTASAPPPACFALFDTEIGRCALVWRGGFFVGAALPEADDDSLRQSLTRRFPGALQVEPSRQASAAVAAVTRLLGGAPEDLSSLPVDLSALAPFEMRVLEATRQIPCGETRTYGELAASLGAPGAARAVGAALGRNPVPIVIPCHRVLAAGGRSGGFSAPGGVTTKLRMLRIEMARQGSGPLLFDHLPLATKAEPPERRQPQNDRPSRAH